MRRRSASDRFEAVYDVMLRSIASGYVEDADFLRMHVGDGFREIVDFAPYATRHERANMILSAYLLCVELLRRQAIDATKRPSIEDTYEVLGRGGLHYDGPVNETSLVSDMNELYTDDTTPTERRAIHAVRMEAQGIEINHQQMRRRRRR